MKSNGTILLVDDDEISNYITSNTIVRNYKSINVESVINGKKAIEYLEKKFDNLPEVILLDINMPIMNGFEFLEWYESSVFFGRIKICMLTTSVRNEDKQKAYQYVDVINYLEKPIFEVDIKEICEQVSDWKEEMQ